MNPSSPVISFKPAYSIRSKGGHSYLGRSCWTSRAFSRRFASRAAAEAVAAAVAKLDSSGTLQLEVVSRNVPSSISLE
jgi:hypothetical protein